VQDGLESSNSLARDIELQDDVVGAGKSQNCTGQPQKMAKCKSKGDLEAKRAGLESG
jgi:hypothetical protein